MAQSPLDVNSPLIWEYQRGDIVKGFSALTLTPYDPPAWCDSSFTPTLAPDRSDPCEEGYEWTTPWVIKCPDGSVSEESASEGWTYD
ncbi:hypothetical protein M427DRAFT_177059 [Gonapodya prolifera JEL478]|uniref:Uncharacterized protein n=1 Tax=Gonapodya prolifera (strain JEL478) TaxID=1344416 RepID=A0A139AQ26_GONPJ|nr:hypothetical protein M427DRAFT_177059 [Gonapodya prolifera JEL478]|eukprot:KXS18828.1 hypothetical protein M427DRAFT_177059 [Gonapodya prolifera JEL478]